MCRLLHALRVGDENGVLHMQACLCYAAKEETDPEVRSVFDAVFEMVKGGTPLSHSMARFPKVFGDRGRVVWTGEIEGDIIGKLAPLFDKSPVGPGSG